jgi:hypothetical protein
VYDSVRPERSTLVFLTVLAAKAGFLHSPTFDTMGFVIYCPEQACLVLVGSLG